MGRSVVYWAPWDMHCNNLGLALGLELVRVSSRVRVRIRVKVRLSIMVRVSIRTSWVNFGPLAAEIDSVVWGTPANFNAFHVLAALLHGSQVVSVTQTLRH